MDQLIVVAKAVALATTVGAFVSIVQERFFGRALDGVQALVLNVGLSLAIGVIAVLQAGGFVITFVQHDPIATAISIFANALVLLAASQAAFRILTKPVATGQTG